MELKDTIALMQSADYKERFKAEYYQTKIRRDKLKQMIDQYEDGILPFTPHCSIDLLKAQERFMRQYLEALYLRAQIEDIDLK